MLRFCCIFCFIGVVAYAFSVLLGITSLPSVTAALSWKEFAFIQSKLGWSCLLFAVAHDLLYGWPYITALSCCVPPTFQVCCPLSKMYHKPSFSIHCMFE